MTELNVRSGGTARLSCRAVEHMICEIWSDYFGRAVSPYDDFFDLGGDSLAMIDVVAVARGRGLPIRSSVALRNSSPARLAESLTVGASDPSAEPLPVTVPALCRGASGRRAETGMCDRPVLITPAGAEPLYVVHSDAHVQAERDAIAAWGSQRPVKGFRLPATLDAVPVGDPVGGIASRLLTALRQEQPTGRYRLAGFGQGAVVAFDMANRLRGQGADVALLALIKPPTVAVAGEPVVGRDQLHLRRLAALAARFGLDGGETAEQVHATMREHGWYDSLVRPADLSQMQQVWTEIERAVRTYRFASYDGPAMLFGDVVDADGPTERALGRAAPNLEIHRFDYGIQSPHAVLADPRLARTMSKALAA